MLAILKHIGRHWRRLLAVCLAGYGLGLAVLLALLWAGCGWGWALSGGRAASWLPWAWQLTTR